jgi:hypothetical protein
MTIVVNFLSVVNRLSKVQWLSKFNVAVQLLTGLGVGIAPTIINLLPVKMFHLIEVSETHSLD